MLDRRAALWPPLTILKGVVDRPGYGAGHINTAWLEWQIAQMIRLTPCRGQECRECEQHRQIHPSLHPGGRPEAAPG
ncbi:putative beta-mannosidase, partial [Clarias magur]